jgi:hypothetical protein
MPPEALPPASPVASSQSELEGLFPAESKPPFEQGQGQGPKPPLERVVGTCFLPSRNCLRQSPPTDSPLAQQSALATAALQGSDPADSCSPCPEERPDYHRRATTDDGDDLQKRSRYFFQSPQCTARHLLIINYGPSPEHYIRHTKAGWEIAIVKRKAKSKARFQLNKQAIHCPCRSRNSERW